MSSINSAGKSEVKAGGMKTSVSAPSGLIAAKISHKSSLFDNDDEDDLFAPATESRYSHSSGGSVQKQTGSLFQLY